MRPRLGSNLLMLSALLLAACGAKDHSHEQGGDHGHGGEEEELPGQAITVWTDRHELFAEYAPLVVGSESGFAAHVTLLPSFKAALGGTVTVKLAQAGGKTLESRADAPKSPGIFRPAITPDTPGACTLTVTIQTEAGADTIPVEGCVVYPDVAAARKALGEEADPPGRITYLKEQAWKTDFANLPVGERDLQPGVRASGRIEPVAGKEARLTAAAAGRALVADPAPILGMPVKKGQLLATIAPRLASVDPATLTAEAVSARAELQAAEAQLARAERLVADEAIPEKQVEEARTRVAVARAALGAATGRIAQQQAAQGGGGGRGSVLVRAPLDGTLVAIEVASGEMVQEGDRLFRVIDLERVWLEARVAEIDLARVENARSAWFTIDGYDTAFTVDDTNGRLVTIGRVIDERNRTVPVIFELANPDSRLRIGQFAKVSIATGQPVKALAIPEQAIVDDAGKPVVYVQVEGEAFERRPLTLGIRSQGWVEVKEGLEAGERVVTRGAYEIKLASAAGSIPAHGHAH